MCQSIRDSQHRAARQGTKSIQPREVYLVIGTSSWAQLLTRRSGRDNTKPVFAGNAKVLSSYHDLHHYAYLVTINRW